MKEVNFCEECKTGSEDDPEAVYCSRCGAAFTVMIRCDNCGYLSPKGLPQNKFCSRCGAAFYDGDRAAFPRSASNPGIRENVSTTPPHPIPKSYPTQAPQAPPPKKKGRNGWLVALGVWLCLNAFGSLLTLAQSIGTKRLLEQFPDLAESEVGGKSAMEVASMLVTYSWFDLLVFAPAAIGGAIILFRRIDSDTIYVSGFLAIRGIVRVIVGLSLSAIAVVVMALLDIAIAAILGYFVYEKRSKMKR